MRPADFVGSATFRLGLLGTTVFVCSITLVFWLVYRSTAAELVQQLDEDILSEQSELSRQAQAKGLGVVREAVELRMHDEVGTDNYYTLIGPSGEVVSSNLPVAAPRPGWFEVRLAVDPHDGTAPGPLVRARGDGIAGGAYLAVGRDRSDVDVVRGVFVRGFLTCVAATIGLTLACSFLFASRVLGRIEAINRATREIMGGDLARRVPVTGRDREFDELAGRLNAMLDRITALMGQVRQVTDDVAHDLRTPLARLRQRLYLARRKARTAEEYERAVDGAIAEADAIIATFASLLRIAQVEAGARRAAFRVVDLSELAEGLVETYTPVAEDLGRRFGGRVEPGVLVLGDPELLGQLLANLIENALNHTPPGSRVALRVARAGREVAVEVVDNGPGIPAGMRGEVFKRFVRLDKSRSTPGSGLGLSLVAAVAELHDATVELADAFPDQPRPGLRAALTLPAAAPARLSAA